MGSSADFDTATKLFLNWFNSHPGTTFHPSLEIVDLRERGAGRGIIAKADIPPDTDLFTIPRSCIISKDTSELARKLPELFDVQKDASQLDNSNSADGEDSDELGSELPTSWLNLILTLLYESFHQRTSKWSSYFDVLPREPSSFDTLMFWREEELSQLQASAMRSKIGKDSANRMFQERMIPFVNKHTDIFYPANTTHLTDDELLEKCHVIGSLIMSYAFDLQPDDDDEDNQENEDGWIEDRSKPSTMGMVPMADMLNADAEFNAHLSHGEENLTMTSIREIKAGEEVLNYYGPLPNGELLRRYGYTSPKHTRYDVVEISWDQVKTVISETLHIPNDPAATAADTLNKTISQLTETEDYETLDLENGFLLDREAGDPDEYGLCTTEARFTAFPEELVSIISELVTRLESGEMRKKRLTGEEDKKRFVKNRTLTVLEAIVRKRMAEYETSVDVDDGLLLREASDGGVGRRLRMALNVRVGEKRLLREALDWTEAMLEKYKEAQQQGSAAQVNGQPPRKKQRKDNR
ncbi:Ribosomal lysine N-methyltransferase 4 [Lithohypha guttulata]|uniref:Ribosomal lysine N-methyltransferase 4 n=1 Tax=Lithohypha guttulata TaxID=1690604 RepID=UPI002DDFA5E2|nr:Ribosomal lysine N-methyltransferase 4 [Lithohypha guttulata]